jgi:ketosteroid isomerase-like protein
MPSARCSEPAEDAALRLLKAYWEADLPGALAACAPAATIALPPSAPFPSPAPIATVLPQIFARVYSRFVGGRCEVAIDRCLTSGSTVMVEYTARGDLVTGDGFVCQYLAVLEIENGKVAGWRAYTDTKYVADKLL